MAKKTLKLSSLGIIIFVAAILILFIAYFWLINQKIMMPVNVSNLVVNGKNISVQGEKIYVDGKYADPKIDLLTYRKYVPYVNFYILTKTEPLFTSSELDSAKLSASVDYLNEQQKLVQGDTGVKNNIMPVNFLQSLASVNKAHTEYLANPSVDNGLNLINQYKKAQEAYAADAQSLLDAYEKAYTGGKNQMFNSFASNTTSQVEISDLKLTIANGKEILKEINKREQLLKGEDVYYAPLNNLSVADYKTYSSPKLLDKSTELAVDNRYLNNLRGPYIVNTSCFLKDKDNKYFYVYDEMFFGKSILMPKQADENYYDKLPAKLGPAQQVYTDAGVNYAHVNEGNNYRCNDLTYQTKLLSLDEFKSQFGDSQLTKTTEYQSAINRSQNQSKAILESTKDFEARYYADKAQSDENLTNLSRSYFNSYLVLAASSDKGDNALAQKFLDRYTFIRNGLSGLDRIVDSSFFFNYLHSLYKGQTQPDSSIGKFLLNRSAYSVTFLDFSPTVWLSGQSPQYLIKNQNNSTVLTFTDLVNKFHLTIPEIQKINGIVTPSQAQALQ